MSFEALVFVVAAQPLPELPDTVEGIRQAWGGAIFLVLLLAAVGGLTHAVFKFRKSLTEMIAKRFESVAGELGDIKSDTKQLLLESRSHGDDIDRLKSRVEDLEHELRGLSTRLSRLEGRVNGPHGVSEVGQ